MTETSTTSTTAGGVTAHALHALADHIAAHQLPAPSEIRIETTHLELAISSEGSRAWSSSLQGSVDSIDRSQGGKGISLEWLTLKGRLPSTGVRVHVQWVRQLRSVTR